MKVSRVGPEYSQAAARVLATAFADEALFAYVLGEGARERRERALYPFILGMVRAHQRFAEIHGATIGRELVGVGIRVPPGHFPLRGRDVLTTMRYGIPGFIRMCTIAPGARRLVKAVGELEKRHPPTRDYWYLAFVGVDPSHRRKGVAAELARYVLDRADRDGAGCYLDTFGEATMRLYVRRGFEVVEEVKPFHDGPTGWGLWREPVKRGEEPPR